MQPRLRLARFLYAHRERPSVGRLLRYFLSSSVYFQFYNLLFLFELLVLIQISERRHAERARQPPGSYFRAQNQWQSIPLSVVRVIRTNSPAWLHIRSPNPSLIIVQFVFLSPCSDIWSLVSGQRRRRVSRIDKECDFSYITVRRDPQLGEGPTNERSSLQAGLGYQSDIHN